MTDPMNALTEFQAAFVIGLIPVERGRLDPDLLFAPDTPNGRVRFNYMRSDNNRLTALVMFAQHGMIEGHPCFNIGYVVDEAHQGKGLAKATLGSALAELANGLAGTRIPFIHIEAVIDVDHSVSQAVAASIFDDAPEAITDSESGLPALHYLRRIDLQNR